MHARIDDAQVGRFAAEVAQLPKDIKGLDFYHAPDRKTHDAEMYPELHHPLAIDFFFFACLHQYGFWYGDRNGYRAPMLATLGGRRFKGSDAVWRVLKRALDESPDLLDPLVLATLKEDELFERVFMHDDGPLPLPDPVTRHALVLGYGRWLLSMRATPSDIVRMANLCSSPLEAFVRTVSGIKGFDGDPFRKKARLLALALMNRPEGFLKPAPGEALGPIVDYHLMRVALRLGLVRLDRFQIERNKERRWCRDKVEAAIRSAVHEALLRVLEISGASPAALDEALWMARKYCPETSVPDCAECRFGNVCAKRIELFQPVFRTTAY